MSKPNGASYPQQQGRKAVIMASATSLITDTTKLICAMTPRRQGFIKAQVREAQKVIDRLAKLDIYGYFTGPALGGPLTLIRPNLSDVLGELEGFVSEEPFSQFKWMELLAELEKVLDNIPTEDITQEGQAQQQQQQNLVQSSPNGSGGSASQESDEVGDSQQQQQQQQQPQQQQNLVQSSAQSRAEVYSHKLKKRAKEFIQAKAVKHAEEVRKVLTEDCIDRISEVNREPAMSTWRREPIPKRMYEELQSYRPAEGISEHEAKEILNKLVAVDEHGVQEKNKWVLPDGLEELEIWAEVLKIDRDSQETGTDIEDWKGCSIPNGDLVEMDTWGIDCFTRRNVEFALGFVEDEKNRLSQKQTHFFIEYCLLRALNVQDKLIASDVTHALRYITKNPRLYCSDGEPNSPGKAWGTSLTQGQVMAAAETLLRIIPEWGLHNFAVHPKGVGVVSKRGIRAGQFVAPYFGEVYPCWLWEQKEVAEDQERKKARDAKAGIVALPDFWNMRLELPAYAPCGYDLMHIDAKRAGNFSSRMSHSCRPNCGTMAAVIDGKYCVAMRSLRHIDSGEELTIDYNCVTDSVDEFRSAVCLCGYHDCRGSYLYIAGAKQMIEVSKRSQTVLHRIALLIESSKQAASSVPSVIDKSSKPESDSMESSTSKIETLPEPVIQPIQLAAPAPAPKKRGRKTKVAIPKAETSQVSLQWLKEMQDMPQPQLLFLLHTLSSSGGGKEMNVLKPEDMERLEKHGLKKCALYQLPDWCLKFASLALLFVENERMELPSQLFSKPPIPGEPVEPSERWEAYQIQATGLFSQRISNLVGTLDKARRFMSERLRRERWWMGDRCLVSAAAAKRADHTKEENHFTPSTVLLAQPHSTEPNSQTLYVLLDDDLKKQKPRPVLVSARDLKKATLEENFPKPLVGTSVMNHQPPFRALSEEEAVYALWGDKISGVAARCITLIERKYERPIAVWRVAYDKGNSRPFWWNFVNREARVDAPSITEQYQMTSFTPTSTLLQMRTLLYTSKVKTLDDAHSALLSLRGLILELPTISDRVLDEQHQKAIDILTLLAHTQNFFILTEYEENATITSRYRRKLPPALDPNWKSSLLFYSESISEALRAAAPTPSAANTATTMASPSKEQPTEATTPQEQSTNTDSVKAEHMTEQQQQQQPQPVLKLKTSAPSSTSNDGEEEQSGSGSDDDNESEPPPPETNGTPSTTTSPLPSSSVTPAGGTPQQQKPKKRRRTPQFLEGYKKKSRSGKKHGSKEKDLVHQMDTLILDFIEKEMKRRWRDPASNLADNSNPIDDLVSSFASWLGHDDEECVRVTDLIGSALLPSIESCYDDSTEIGYSSFARQLLVHRITSEKYEPWSSCIKGMFPGASLPPPCPDQQLVHGADTLPPPRLFGSPFLDAALQDNADYAEACKKYRDSKKADKNKMITKLTTSLRNGRRTQSSIAASEKKQIQPPKPPSESPTTWIQCEHTECGKWRKLPAHIKPDSFPEPFYCSHLAPFDPIHANCSQAEDPYDSETESSTSNEGGTSSSQDSSHQQSQSQSQQQQEKESSVLLNLSTSPVGTRMDSFDIESMSWVKAEVMDSSEEAIKLRIDLTLDMKHFDYNVFQWTANTYVTKEKDGEEKVYREEWVQKIDRTSEQEGSLQASSAKTSGLLPFETELAPLFTHTKRTAKDIEIERRQKREEEEERKRKKILEDLLIASQQFEKMSAVETDVTSVMNSMLNRIVKEENAKRRLDPKEDIRAQQFQARLLGFRNYFCALKQVEPNCPWVRANARWTAMTEAQQKKWETAKNALAPPRFSNAQIEEFHQQESFKTPKGVGVVIYPQQPISSLPGKSPLTALIGLHAQRGMHVITKFGPGTIIECPTKQIHRGQMPVIIELDGWNGKLYAPTASVVVRASLSSPSSGEFEEHPGSMKSSPVKETAKRPREDPLEQDREKSSPRPKLADSSVEGSVVVVAPIPEVAKEKEGSALSVNLSAT